jgi:hypothetical protein
MHENSLATNSSNTIAELNHRLNEIVNSRNNSQATFIENQGEESGIGNNLSEFLGYMEFYGPD